MAGKIKWDQIGEKTIENGVDRGVLWVPTITDGKPVYTSGDAIIITVKGKSAHAMEPEKGRNAAVYLAKFLQSVLTGGHDKQFVDFLVTVFDGDHYGSALKLHFEDEMSGPTTLNPGIVTFTESGATIEISMRYSVLYTFEVFSVLSLFFFKPFEKRATMSFHRKGPISK